MTHDRESEPSRATATYRWLPAGRAEKTAWSLNGILVPANMVTMFGEIDASGIEEVRDGFRREGKRPPSYTAFVIKAAGQTMKRHPEANRAILGPPFWRRLVQFEAADIAVAIEKHLPYLPGNAFIAPLRSADSRSLDDLSEALRALPDVNEENSEEYRAYMRVLRYVPRPISTWLVHAPHWFPSLWVRYRGCACWVNAPSKAGVDAVTTTWPWPITFTFGVVKDRPLVVDSAVTARRTMPVGMVFDRRIMGGGPASRLFVDFTENLSRGTKL